MTRHVVMLWECITLQGLVYVCFLLTAIAASAVALAVLRTLNLELNEFIDARAADFDSDFDGAAGFDPGEDLDNASMSPLSLAEALALEWKKIPKNASVTVSRSQSNSRA